MPIEVRDGGLSWKARIDTTELERDSKKVADTLSGITAEQKKKEAALLQSLSKNYKSVYQDGLRAFQDLNPEMQKQVRILQSFQTELTKVGQAQKQLDNDLKSGTISQRQYNQAMAGLSVRTREINENISRYNRYIQSNRAVMDASNSSIAQKRARLSQLRATMEQLTASELRNSQSSRVMRREIVSLERDIRRFDRSMRSAQRSGRLMNQVLLATTGFFTITQGSRLIRDIIQTRGEIEQLEVAFSTMLNSKERADALMAEIVQVATTTPFKLTEVADATKQLLAYGFAQEEIKPELIAIGNIASGVGATFQEVAYAYGTLKTQGRAFARDIRQFTTRGIPIVGQLAEQFGVTEAKINDMVSAGQIGFPEVQKAFQSMTSSGGQFFNLMEKQSQTVTGEIAKLQDRIQLMFNQIGEGNEGLIKSGIAGLSFLVENYESVITTIKALILVYGSYRTALILTAASQAALGTSTFALSRLFVGARTALMGLNAAFVTSPVGAYTAIISALGLAIYSLTQTINTAKSVQKNYNDAIQEGEKAGAKELSRINELVGVLKNELATREQKVAAMNQLNLLMGDSIKDLTAEEIAAGKAANAIEAYTKSIKKNIATQEAYKQLQSINESLDELNTKGIEAIGMFRRVGESMRNTFDPTRGAQLSLRDWFSAFISGSGTDDVIVNQAKRDLETQRDSLLEAFDFTEIITGTGGKKETNKRAFDELISDTVANFDRLVGLIQDKGDAETIRKNLQDYLDSLAPNDSQIAEVKKKILAINNVLSNYNIKEENKELRDVEKERKMVLNDIQKMEDQFFKKSFDKREQEIQQVRKQFEDLRKAAIDAGLGGTVLTRIDNIESQATGDIRYRAETEDLKKELERRRQLYTDYENMIAEMGLQKANARYEGELDIAKNYIDLIRDEYEKLSMMDPGQRRGVENERLRFLEEELNRERQLQEKQQNQLLQSVQDYETQRELIREKYILNREKLQGVANREQLQELERQYHEEIAALDDANAQKLGIYRRLFMGIETLSIRAAKSLVGTAREQLQELKKTGRVTEGFYREMLGRIEQAERSIESRLPMAMQDVSRSMADVARSVGDTNKAFGETLGLLANIIQRTGQVKQNINDYMQAMRANDGAGDVLGMVTAGAGVAGAILGGISVMMTAANNYAKQQLELYKEQLRFQRQILYGELAVNRLYRDREMLAAEVQGSTLQTLNNQREILAKSLEEIENDIRKISDTFNTELTWKMAMDLDRMLSAGKEGIDKAMEEMGNFLFRTGETKSIRSGLFGLGSKEIDVFETLAGLSFEQIEELSVGGKLTQQAEEAFQELKRLKEEGIEVEKQLREIQNELDNIFTGGLTWTGLADGIIAEFQGAGSDIEGIIRNAILSGFKYRFLEGPLNELIDQFAEDAQSDGELTQGEIARFTQAYTQLSENAQEALKQLQEATGIDLTGAQSQQTGLSGAIRRELTEETGTLLAGLTRAQFDMIKRIESHATEGIRQGVMQINHLGQIEMNTLHTVDQLKLTIIELKAINKNTKDKGMRGYTS
ncbi:tape measure protein [Pleomorphovibrio marinus]|uniref:tape measure protein n=1 Tax=Pleomorphovibrio marinus TaxID=2164132 RepID=UPI000E0BF2A7|nr:tape measure protein [Pleomorphovibrio marinus]